MSELSISSFKWITVRKMVWMLYICALIGCLLGAVMITVLKDKITHEFRILDI